MSDIITVVDHVEDAEKDGKKYVKMTDKDGNTYGIGSWLEKKWNILQSGTAVKLIMATHNATGREYVKDLDRCQDIMEAKKMMQQQQQRPKSTIDISIEAQVAVKCATDLMSNGVECPEDIKELAFEWMRNSIKAAI